MRWIYRQCFVRSYSVRRTLTVRSEALPQRRSARQGRSNLPRRPERGGVLMLQKRARVRRVASLDFAFILRFVNVSQSDGD